MQTRDQRLAWMIILATIPVGLVGVVADKPFREVFGKPIVAGVFLIVNGVILYCGERFRPQSSVRADQEVAAQRQAALVPAAAGARRQPVPAGPGMARQARHASGQQAVRQEELMLAIQADERLSRMGYLRALIIGASQILALLAGISRDGVTMVTGMARGLSREDAARFAFLLATPVILAAGVLELPKLTGPEGNGIHGQILVGSLLSGIGAYVSVRFLMRYFQTRTLTPFAIYCFVFGLLSVIYLGVHQVGSRRQPASWSGRGDDRPLAGPEECSPPGSRRLRVSLVAPALTGPPVAQSWPGSAPRTQNSLPSGSASTAQGDAPCPTSARRAPRPISRSTSASCEQPAGLTSRCRRFLAALPSGTATNTSDGTMGALRT